MTKERENKHKEARVNVTTSIGVSDFDRAKFYNISWSEALILGINEMIKRGEKRKCRQE